MNRLAEALEAFNAREAAKEACSAAATDAECPTPDRGACPAAHPVVDKPRLAESEENKSRKF
jgi:hypothetical protein